MSAADTSSICHLTSDQFTRYIIGDRVLGEGGYGQVREGFNIDTQEPVAVKIQNKLKLSAIAIERISHECQILSELDHPSIIRIEGGYDNGETIYWVLSLMRGGDLLQHLKKRGKLPISEALHVFRQLLDAVAYCHSKDIIHRDIKLENILLREECSNLSSCSIVLGDFGLATRQKITDPDLTDIIGSPQYVAPEILRMKPYKGRPVDVWSMGICLYTMLQYQFPFRGKNDQETFRLIKHAPVPDTITHPIIKLLIQRMLDKLPPTRLKIDAIYFYLKKVV